MTQGEALTATEFHENNARRANGTCYVHRRNGQTQTWKTRPDEFRVPVKYGLRGHGNVTQTNVAQFHLPGQCGQFT